MWDGDTVVELSRQWGVVPAIDPFLLTDPLDLEAFPFAYYRLAGRGATLRRFSPSHFDMLVSEHLHKRPGYLVFVNQNRWHDAKRFVKFLRQFDDAV